MASNFSDLLSTPMDEIERPKPAPAGDYFGIISAHKLDESSQKKTPYVRYTLKPTGPADEELDLEGIDLSKKTFTKDFYLSVDARYRLKDFLETVGINTSGRSLGECIPEALNAQVRFSVILRPSEDGKEFFNEVKDIVGVED